MPLGVEKSTLINVLFLVILIGTLIGGLYIIMIYYESILRFTLRFRWAFLLVVSILVFFGIRIMQNTSKEFMTSLVECEFLLMFTLLSHYWVVENIKQLYLLDV